MQIAGDSIANQKASDGGTSASQKAPSSEAVTSAASQIAAAVNNAGKCLLNAQTLASKTTPAVNGTLWFDQSRFLHGYTMKAVWHTVDRCLLCMLQVTQLPVRRCLMVKPPQKLFQKLQQL